MNQINDLFDCVYDINEKNSFNLDLTAINAMIKILTEDNNISNYEYNSISILLNELSKMINNIFTAEIQLNNKIGVLNQNYKLHEIIILDDKSTDNSVEVINTIVKKIKKYINIKTIYNEKNSGSAFKQWKKGFEEATGDYVWIAEADDYCEPNLISNLVKQLKNNKNIRISYADTAFIDVNGYITMKSIVPEIDIQKSNHWNCNYVNNGLEEINNYSYGNNTIANASSCIIKRDDNSKFLKVAGEYKQAGDWLLYMEIMALGDIAYYAKALNYYRLHGNNVSATMKQQKHLEELNKLYDYYVDKFKLTKNHKKNIN